MKSKVLLFGANGQLGTEFRQAADAAGLPITALTRSDVDIADPGAVQAALDRAQPSLVVNAAAYTRVDDAEIEREAAIRGNVTGPEALAKACVRADAALVHISSDYVFDGEKQGSYSETDAVAPIGFYGRTKADGEAAIRANLARHVILRVSWLYGEFGNNFLKTMLRLASQRDEIAVVADQHGSPTSTKDVYRAIAAVAGQIERGGDIFGTYHFTGYGATTWHGFAAAALGKYGELTGRKINVRPITTAEYPTRTKRPANSTLDCSKFERTFGVRANFWRSEVEDTVERLVPKSAF
ncbi:MAG TPA: dTDP-4-dehydrorhamnose reductase [Xanthobacteraceae bacterium]|nr:dTDP-4-dehydrorhamnose reductase [Xanthobacteraceae bacterium]